MRYLPTERLIALLVFVGAEKGDHLVELFIAEGEHVFQPLLLQDEADGIGGMLVDECAVHGIDHGLRSLSRRLHLAECGRFATRSLSCAELCLTSHIAYLPCCQLGIEHVVAPLLVVLLSLSALNA